MTQNLVSDVSKKYENLKMLRQTPQEEKVIYTFPHHHEHVWASFKKFSFKAKQGSIVKDDKDFVFTDFWKQFIF